MLNVCMYVCKFVEERCVEMNLIRIFIPCFDSLQDGFLQKEGGGG